MYAVCPNEDMSDSPRERWFPCILLRNDTSVETGLLVMWVMLGFVLFNCRQADSCACDCMNASIVPIRVYGCVFRERV